MKTIKFSLVILLLMTVNLSIAQSEKPNNDVKPYIEVNGTAEKEIIPDEIYIGIVIREKYVNKVKVTIEEQENKLRTALKNIGIKLEDLSLSDANADYVKVSWQKKSVITQKEYTLKVSTASMVGLVFQELESLEIRDARIERTSHSKIDSLRKEVRIMAIKAAKDKADYLLEAIGEQTGQPQIITESPSMYALEIQKLPTRNINSLVSSSAGIYQGAEEKREEIQFQKIKLQTTIYVKFSIK